MFAAVLILGVGADPAPPAFEVVNKVPPAFQVTNRVPAPPPAVVVAPQLVRPSADPEWRDEYRPEYGGWVKVRTVPAPAVTKSGVVPGVTTGPRPFPAGATTDATRGTGAQTQPAITSPPTTAGAPRTTAPTASRGATPTGADTGIGARVASPGGGIELFGLPPGTTVKRNPDGSTTVCPPWG
jgi:hypothetical protein